MHQTSPAVTAGAGWAGRTTLEKCRAVSTKSKHALSHGPAIPLPGVHLAEMHMHVHQNTGGRMSIAVLGIVTSC